MTEFEAAFAVLVFMCPLLAGIAASLFLEVGHLRTEVAALRCRLAHLKEGKE